MAVAELRPEGLYHLASEAEWGTYRAAGIIDPASLAIEGFVHCSYGRQVAGTVEKHFNGVTGLLALELDPSAFGDVHLVDEDSYGSGQAFPHAYGPIPAAAVQSSTHVA